MKRVKKGLSMRLPGSKTRWVLAKEHDGMLRLEDEAPTSYDTVFLTAAQCEALGMTAVLEDVPTPGERLLAALESEGLRVTSEMRGPAGYMACLERVAEALGMEPESES